MTGTHTDGDGEGLADINGTTGAELLPTGAGTNGPEFEPNSPGTTGLEVDPGETGPGLVEDTG